MNIRALNEAIAASAIVHATTQIKYFQRNARKIINFFHHRRASNLLNLIIQKFHKKTKNCHSLSSVITILSMISIVFYVFSPRLTQDSTSSSIDQKIDDLLRPLISSSSSRIVKMLCGNNNGNITST